MVFLLCSSLLSDSSSLISILLESERILSMLSIPDLLSLYFFGVFVLASACVNSHCHRLIRQESVWESLLQDFPSESIEQIKNPWIRHQWTRLHSNTSKETDRSVWRRWFSTQSRSLSFGTNTRRFPPLLKNCWRKESNWSSPLCICITVWGIIKAGTATTTISVTISTLRITRQKNSAWFSQESSYLSWTISFDR